MFVIVIISIAIISIILAVRSYKSLNRMEEVDTAQEELKRGKIIFQKDS